MNDIETPDPDVNLDRYMASLRDTPISDGPSPETFAAALALLEGSATVVRPSIRQRSRHFLEMLMILFRQPLFRAASIAAACALLYILLLSPFGTSITLADVASKLKEAHTLTYTTTTTMGKNPPVASKTYIGEQGRFRNEAPGAAVAILRGRRSLLLFPFNHTATQTDILGQPTLPDVSIADPMVDWLRHLGDRAAKPIGEKTIDGIAVKGFITSSYSGTPATVWADAKTGMPVRIELEMSAGGQDTKMVMSDFELGVPLDDSLFSLDLPAGYTLTKQTMTLPKLGKVEDEVARLIGDYAKLNDGNFPDDLMDMYGIIKGYVKADKAAQLDMSARISGIFAKLFSLPNGYGYAGKGAKLGEKDKIIFWIKPSASEKTTRAIYGDLRITDVPVESLPITQPAP
jgi:outer membrane lipoprotein-sorting protein